jgi:hypothetical protein
MGEFWSGGWGDRELGIGNWALGIEVLIFPMPIAHCPLPTNY